MSAEGIDEENDTGFEPLGEMPSYTKAEQIKRAKDFFNHMAKRRTVREFSSRPVPRQVIEYAIKSAGRAPSGANKQPWHFAVISNPSMKAKLRVAAEAEEQEFYGGRAGDEWLADLEKFGTDANKPFLETAPWLIVVFRQPYDVDEDGVKHVNYYAPESVGLAGGMLLAALHDAGLVTLTHTPSPMGFLNELCDRPKQEKAMMLVVAGLPATDAEVPVITKKSLEEISTFFD